MKITTWLIALTLFATILNAQGIRFVEKNSWKEVLALAKKQNKLIFLDAYATWCGPCQYMQEEVFTNSKVGAFFNSHFINVKMDMEKGEGPQLSEDLGVGAYPTFYFIDGEGKPVHKSVGALEEGKFIALGTEALNPEKQYYTIKEKATVGKIAPEAFHDWIHIAKKMEDVDLDDVTNSYFEKTTYPIANYHMLVMIMDHAEHITESQLRYLYKEADSVAAITEKSREYVHEVFRKKLVAYATLKSTKGETIDFDVFKSILLQFPPINAELETRKQKIRHFAEKEQTERAADELLACISDPRSGLNVEELFLLVNGNLYEIIASKRDEKIVRLIKAYPVTEAEKKKSYYIDLALFAIYVSKKDNEKARQYASAVLKNENVEEAYKEKILNILDEFKISLNEN